MKKNLLPLLAGIMILLSSCSKDDDSSAARAGIPSNPSAGSDYVELNIGTTHHKIQEVATMTEYATGSAKLVNNSYGQYFTISFMNVTAPGDLLNFSAKIPLSDAPGVGQYTFPVDFLEVQAYDRFNNLYFSQNGSIMTLNITSLDSNNGGKITGTFSITNMKRTNGTTQASETGIQISSGKFSATFE